MYYASIRQPILHYHDQRHGNSIVVWQNIGKIYPNLEIHTDANILIDLCSAEARVIISTGSTKFYPVAIF